jgi:hypothetical protein
MATSDALEIVEGLAAGEAAIERLAGRRAEFRNALGLARTAFGAGDLHLAEERADGAGRLFRRRDAVVAQLLAAFLVIQSVVQAGDMTRSMRGSKPASRSAASTASSMAVTAGQPE